MGSAVSVSVCGGPNTSHPSPMTQARGGGESPRGTDDSSQNPPPTLVRRILRGAQNMWVKAGQVVGQRFAKLVPHRREIEMAPGGSNSTQHQQSPMHADVENPPDQRRDAAADPNNTQNLQQSQNGDPLKGCSTISKILCGATLVLIVDIVFLQIANPTHPYSWIAITELPIQSSTLVVIMIGFYVGEKNLSAAMWLHRTGHMLFLEGIAIAAVYRFHWSPSFTPLVLLPVPAALLPVYLCV